MNIGKCGTCKHWDTGEFATRDDRAACLAIPHVNSADPEALAVTSDVEGYSASLLTAAEFGCVLHESAASAR